MIKICLKKGGDDANMKPSWLDLFHWSWCIHVHVVFWNQCKINTWLNALSSCTKILDDLTYCKTWWLWQHEVYMRNFVLCITKIVVLQTSWSHHVAPPTMYISSIIMYETIPFLTLPAAKIFTWYWLWQKNLQIAPCLLAWNNSLALNVDIHCCCTISLSRFSVMVTLFGCWCFFFYTLEILFGVCIMYGRCT